MLTGSALPHSWNDLIVGAPFYFDRMKFQGGAVYIFMNENGSFQKSATKVLQGPVTSGFGTAVAAIGDINQDGFQGQRVICAVGQLAFVPHPGSRASSGLKLKVCCHLEVFFNGSIFFKL